MITAIALRMIGTAVAKRLILKILAVLAKRTDNTIDDDIVSLFQQVMDGDVSKVKKSALKKK